MLHKILFFSRLVQTVPRVDFQTVRTVRVSKAIFRHFQTNSGKCHQGNVRSKKRRLEKVQKVFGGYQAVH